MTQASEEEREMTTIRSRSTCTCVQAGFVLPDQPLDADDVSVGAPCPVHPWVEVVPAQSHGALAARIERLAADAAAAGDPDQVELCAAALSGDDEALSACVLRLLGGGILAEEVEDALD